jgi:SNF2 family DNA or RNA helicase
MRKWDKQGWLSDIDQKRILCCIQNMRMLCNSTFLFDKQTHHSPKLEEFREILTELAIEENRKVVVFSEYERMTYLAGKELSKLGIGFVSLHDRLLDPGSEFRVHRQWYLSTAMDARWERTSP